MDKKQKTWIRPRHKIIRVLLYLPILIATYGKYRIKPEKFAGEGDRNWLVIANHQTDFDQFFISLAFKKPVYYVAMEDLFSKGFISRLISWLVAPIPFVKGTSDIRAVMNCIKLAKEGGTIALFPEGNRTYSGRTCYIKPSVASLAKKLGLPIAIFKIEGGYGVNPRWAVEPRRGKMTAGVRRVIEPEEYKNMSKEELYELICKELWVDEAAESGEYHCKALAEGLERVIYVCPDCGLSEFETHGDTLICRHCGSKYKYLPNKQLEAENGEGRFEYVADWYDYQESYVRRMDLSPYIDFPMYSDTASIYEVEMYDRKRLCRKDAKINLFGDRLEIGDDMVMSYDDISSMTCVAGHKLNIYYGMKLYQIKGDKSFNALKYCNIYYHAKFVKEEPTDGKFQFLGL